MEHQKQLKNIQQFETEYGSIVNNVEWQWIGWVYTVYLSVYFREEGFSIYTDFICLLLALQLTEMFFFLRSLAPIYSWNVEKKQICHLYDDIQYFKVWADLAISEFRYRISWNAAFKLVQVYCSYKQMTIQLKNSNSTISILLPSK